MDQFDPKQQKNKPKFDVIEPSIVGAQFASPEDVSFSSFLKPHINNKKKNKNNNTEESDQISIFDAAKYFSGVHDNLLQKQRDKELDVVSPIPPRLSSVSSSVETTSSYGARHSESSDRTRSFRATPTASSEASWNSQAGLLVNPPGSVGINIIKSLTNNSTWSRGTTNNSHVSSKGPRFSTKWLNRGRKCPCYGKKAVRVEEKMVDLRKSTSSNASNSLYSFRQSSPKSIGTNLTLTKLSTHPHDSKSSNVDVMASNPIQTFEDNSNNNGNNNGSNGGFSPLGLNSKVVGPLTLYDDVAAATPTIAIARTTSNGFTFPILENNQPIGLKKMLNIRHPGNEDLHRDSLEAFQPKCLQSSKSRRTSYEDENVSDGSSDLFEIESFSTMTYPCRDSIDEVIVPSLNTGSHGFKSRYRS
ncbi:protein PHYTOCHROME KINASE SUBSTRATE 4-like [Silene latifolia]|uniref:protein PHYTOCHROME KINASE SUBSTRATE 4-like n=1 Tax=Silene latifolia TaxID=37657 RepID=UPI003D778114